MFYRGRPRPNSRKTWNHTVWRIGNWFEELAGAETLYGTGKHHPYPILASSTSGYWDSNSNNNTKNNKHTLRTFTLDGASEQVTPPYSSIPPTKPDQTPNNKNTYCRESKGINRDLDNPFSTPLSISKDAIWTGITFLFPRKIQFGNSRRKDVDWNGDMWPDPPIVQARSGQSNSRKIDRAVARLG